MSKIVRNIPDGLEASYADIKLDTISDLVNLTGTPPEIVWVSGYHTKGDGSYGSHIFEWDPNSTEPHNGGTIIELGATFPTDWSDQTQLDNWYNYSGGSTGRYKLKYNGAVNVKWFGGELGRASLVGEDVIIDSDITYTGDITTEISLIGVGHPIVSGNINLAVPVNLSGIEFYDTLYLNKNAVTGYTFDSTIESCIFSSTQEGINIDSVRGVAIEKNIFKNNTDSIYLQSFDFHKTSMINISNKNIFKNVNNALYVKKSSVIYGVADCSFNNNVINYAKNNGIYIEDIDGINIHENIMFFPSYVTKYPDKDHNIYIESASQIMISGNQLFEAGLEAINVKSTYYDSNGKIYNNNIIWPSQKKLRSAIFANGGIDITDNTIYGFTKHGIESTVKYSGTISGNSISTKDALPSYYGVDLGEPAQSTIQHNSIDVVSDDEYSVIIGINKYINYLSNGTRNKIEFPVVINGEKRVLAQLNRMSGISATEKEISVTTDTTIASLKGLSGSIDFGGLIIMTARNGVVDSTINITTYILNVNMYGNVGSVDTISANGLTTGGGSNHPSFTFSMSGSDLIATPVGSTSGVFYFTFSTIGDISIF